MRAVVIGAGYAGQGHTAALRYAGVEVVAICGRVPSVVETIAEELGIGVASVDWEETLRDIRPEIVALATPASLRLPVIQMAASLGCHIYCDKPLATTMAEARECLHTVSSAGVKHAFAATRRYDPSVVWLSELVRNGRIGRVFSVEFLTPTSLTPILPWSWAMDLAQGGGLLNNQFSHLLSIFERVLDGPAEFVGGSALFEIDTAPYVPGIHDFRDWAAKADEFTAAELETLDWRPCDIDTSYVALLRIGQAQIRVTTGVPDSVASMTLTGEHGVIVARGELQYEISIDGEDLPVPDRLIGDLPRIGLGVEDRWAALARDFVADINGLDFQPYLTFEDGCRYQQIIENVRSGSSPL